MQTKHLISILVLSLGLLLAPLTGGQSVSATLSQPTANASAALSPLETLLNPDGTLNLATGFSGSLDVRGWQMATGPDGTPRFTRASAPLSDVNAPAAAGDEWWDDQFLLGVYYTPQPGNSSVFAIAVSGTNVYVGGDFDRAGNVAASHIAKWDSVAHRWSALGSGVNNRVLAIAASGDDVYVGGNFSRAGGISTGRVAHWDEATRTWSALGDELGHTSAAPEVSAIAIAANGDVYVGGYFETAGGVTVNNIARWDGSAWHALSSGTGGTFHDVLAIAISGDDVYIGGEFETAGGYPRRHVARWNGSTWLGLGGGADDTVNAIVINGSNVYIGGEFETVNDGSGDHTVGHVAMWNGSAWDTMGDGVGDPDVAALAVGPDGIYVGGRFHTLADGSTSANRLARWDGSAWHMLGGGALMGSDGVTSNVYALAFLEDQMYLGGFMDASNDGRTLAHIGYWDVSDEEWYALGNSVNGPVYALALYGDDVYLGGDFSSAGGIKASSIARWDSFTGKWSEVSGGVSSCTGSTTIGCTPTVYAITVDGDDIYVGGNFIYAGSVPVHGIARLDPATGAWYALGGGVICDGIGCSAYVRAIDAADGSVYVGGNFDYAGSSVNQVNNISEWNGDSWRVLGNGTNGVNDTVYAVRVIDSVLYIGGIFTSPVSHMAKLTGVGWVSLNTDVIDGPVYAIEPVGQFIYVGGAFTNLGGPDGDHISDFHTNDWHQLAGGGLDNIVYALDTYPTFVGGDFTTSGITGLNRIARYANSTWSNYGSGTDDTVRAIAYDGQYLYVGGSFFNAGDKPSFYFGRWGIEYDVYLPLVVK
jgi:hypothetical protein